MVIATSLDDGGAVVPADQRTTNAAAAAAANTKTADSFTVQKSGLNVVVNKVYPFSFSYLYDNPDNPSEPIVGVRSPNFLFTLQTPDLTMPVTNLVVTPGLLSYGVKWDLIDKALAANKWLIDIQIYESLTGAFAGEEYLVWDGNGSSATILVSNTANRWIRVDTRDQDYRKKSVTYGPFKATDPIVVDTTGPANVGSVTTVGSLDLDGIIGFNGHATISWAPVTGGGIRGYRIRWRQVATPATSYAYVDSPGDATSYHLSNLGVGLTYEFAVATYDEYNNTSSQYIAGNNITITGTPYIAGTVDVAGYFRAKANPTDADSTAFKFGYGIDTGKRGLSFNGNNYWNIDSNQSALFKVGGPTTNYLLWDGAKLTVDGDINAKGGNFSGNIFMSTTGASIYNGTIDSATGNLTGNGFALNSTGLKVANGTNSVTIAASTGTITANAGSIAGWNLSGTTLSKNNVILDSTGQIQVGSAAASSVYLGVNSGFVMWAGNNTPDANAKFRVAADGTLYAQNAVLGSGTQLTGYATTAALSNYATTSALSNYATTSDVNGVRNTANNALPAVNFDKTAIIQKINASTNGTWINGGVLEAGTVIADNVVSTYVYAGYINADKINAGTIGATVKITTPNITVGSEYDSYYFRTNQIRTGTSRAALGLNNVNMISADSAGMLSSWYPYNTDDVSLGIVSPYVQRWKNIYLINNPNVSSDLRLKKDISETGLGLNFIKSLRPVQYKLKARSRKDKIDENGNVVYYPGTDKAIPELDEDNPGNRYHYGFIAQEVKGALDLNGVGDQAGLWAIDNLEEPDSTQALVYSEFISPLTKAVQELSNMVESLQQEVNVLKGK